MVYVPSFIFTTIIWGVIFAYAYSHVPFGVAVLFLLAGMIQWVCGVLFVDALCEVKDEWDKKRINRDLSIS